LAFTLPVVFDSSKRRFIIIVPQDKTTVAYYHYHDSFFIEKNSKNIHYSKVMTTNNNANKLITTSYAPPASYISLLTFNTNLLSSEADLDSGTATPTITTPMNTGSTNVIGDDNGISMQSTSSHDDDNTNPEIDSVTVEQPRTNNDKQTATEDDIQIELGKDHVMVDTEQDTANNNNNIAAIDNERQQGTIDEGNTIVTIEQSVEKKGGEQRVPVEEQQQQELEDKGTVRLTEQQMENVPATEQEVERGVVVAVEEQQTHAEMEDMKLIEQQQKADDIVTDQTAHEEETHTMEEGAKEVDHIAVVEQQKAPTE
jgi:hypothetical protein